MNVKHEHAAALGDLDGGTWSLGFLPAFLDFATMKTYPSRFADGRLAPFHLLDGLPAEVVVHRAPSGRPTRAKASLVAGFLRNGFFYTRRAVARAIGEWPTRTA